MWKFLIFAVLLGSLPLFLTDAFSLEVEIQKESDRVIESMGWSQPNKISLQEQIQIIIDKPNQKNRISVGLLSTDPNDIKFPDYLEDINSNPMIHSFTLTNKFACAPTQTDRACVIIEVKREGLGNSLQEITENARKITDKIISGGVILFAPEFYSVSVEGKNSMVTNEKITIAKVVYTVNKQKTDNLFDALSTMLLSNDIRTAGGFYDVATKLSMHHFSEFTIGLIPLENNMLRTMHIALVCSNVTRELPDCGVENIDEQIARGDIDPLALLQVQDVERSKIFRDDFLPLNSLIHVLVYNDEKIEVKSTNSNVIKKFETIGDLQESGWAFVSKSGEKIDARYIFGSDTIVSKNDLIFSVGPYSGEDIKIKNTEEGGGCLIATATFGSELSPQVQFLRELRDNTVLQTQSGTSFMTGFNQFYYSFSPIIADYERENPTFKEAVKITLTPLLTSLTLLQYADIDSESEMLGYGIGIILLNIGIYFVTPAVLIMKIKKRI